VSVGHSDLGGKVRVLFSGILDQGCARYVVRARGAGRWSLRVRSAGPWGKRKKKFWNSRANWESLMRAGPTTLGAVLDAGEHSGPRWTGDARLARRRRYSTARRDRAHSLKEAKGRAGTARSNQRSSNTLYCRVNVRVNDEVRRGSCSSSLINFVLNLSELFLMNCRMSSS